MHEPTHGAVPAGLHARVPRGVPVTVTQVPGGPEVSAHDWHVPLHATLQQTLSTQKLFRHSLFAVQLAPFGLSAVHEPALQVSDVLHVVPPQQGWPAAPQRQLLDVSQTRFAAHWVVPPQQGWSLAPHVAQVVPEQTVPTAQTPPVQHCRPAVPHAEQVPVPSQAVPEALQVPPTPPQQGCPEPPHTQVPVAVAHTRLAPHAGAPGQQAWFTPPQATQFPVDPQMPPALQLEPPQQGWPTPPHVLQVPPEQVVEVAVHMLPAQHRALRAPQGMQLPPEHTVPVAVQVLPTQQG